MPQENSFTTHQDTQVYGLDSIGYDLESACNTRVSDENADLFSGISISDHSRVVHEGFVPLEGPAEGSAGSESGLEETEPIQWHEGFQWDEEQLIFDHGHSMSSSNEGAHNNAKKQGPGPTSRPRGSVPRSGICLGTSGLAVEGEELSMNTTKSVVPRKAANSSSTEPFSPCQSAHINPEHLKAYATRVYQENKYFNEHLPAPKWHTDRQSIAGRDGVACMLDAEDPLKLLRDRKAILKWTSQYRSTETSEISAIQSLEQQWGLAYQRNAQTGKGKTAMHRSIDRRSKCPSVFYRAHLWACTYLTELEVGVGVDQKSEIKAEDLDDKYDLDTLLYVSDAFMIPWEGQEADGRTLVRSTKNKTPSASGKTGAKKR